MRLLVFLLMLLVTLLHAASNKEEVTIALKWFYQYQFAGYIMAKEQGYYDEVGLDVTLIERDPNQNHIEQVIQGRAQYGVSDSSLLVYRAKGAPIKIISTVFQHNAMVLISKKSSGIVSPYEMRGKRVSYQNGVDDAIFASMFEYANLGRNDFIKLPMDFSYESFINDEIDVIAAYITDQPYWIAKRGYELNIINPLSYGIDLYGDNLFTTEVEIAHHPDRVIKMKAASLKGWRYAIEHPEETANVIREKYKPSLDYDQLMFEARATIRLIAPQYVELGYTSKDRFRYIASIFDDGRVESDALMRAVDEIIYRPDSIQERIRHYAWVGAVMVVVFGAIALLLYIHNRRLDRMVKERTLELEHSKKVAEEAAASKARFLANMSHEIRTPMNAILGFAQLLSKDEHDVKRRERFAIIESSGKTLLGIINDILDISKIESGKLFIEQHPTDIKQLANESLKLFEATMAQKKLQCTLICGSDVPKCLMLDNVRIQQVVYNLLGNAIKFTPDEGTIIVHIGYDFFKRSLHVSIQDSGIGIATEKLKSIFDPFSQEDVSTTRQFGGTGLGLSISSKLVALMGGLLNVQSKQDEGSRFYFNLKSEMCEGEIEGVSHSPDVAQPEPMKGTVLVVEDNKTNQMLMTIILEMFGVAYEIANDGVEAFDKVQHQRFDLILMDENMPNMSGIEATKAIHAYEKERGYQATPIIAVTANAVDGDWTRFLEAGMREYISKPYTEEQIEGVLKRYLG